MHSALKRAPHTFGAILTIATMLGLVPCSAFADAPPAQRTTWGQLKARYHTAAPEQAESFKNQNANIPKKVAKLTSLSLSPTTVTGGGTAQGSVALSGGAPTGGAVVTLASNNALASVPATVTISAGSKTATFTVTTSVPVVDGNATLSATYNGITRNVTLAVTVHAAPPPPPVAASLSSVSLAPSSITAGSSSVGTVTLSAAAPAGGALIDLASGNPALVGVPADVTIAAGSTSATFPLSSTPSLLGGNVIITASYLGASRSATLRVAPTDPCASVNGLSGEAAVSSASVPQFRTGRLRIDLVGDVPAGWINAMGSCATSGAPAVAFISGTGDVTLSSSGASVTGKATPLAFGALTVPPGEAGVLLATDAAGNNLEIIWPALSGLPPGQPVMRMNLVSWTAAVQTGVALDAAMTFRVRSADGSVATFTAHGANMIVPVFKP